MDEEQPNLDEKAEETDAKKYPNLSEEQIDEITEIFETFDKDKDALLSFFELSQMLRWLNFNPTQAEVDGYAEKYDGAKSGLIGLRNIKEICNKKVMQPDTIEELVEAMKILDTTKDGTISMPELRWAMTKLGDKLEDQVVDDMIKEIDPENKGFVDILQFAETTFNIKEVKKKEKK